MKHVVLTKRELQVAKLIAKGLTQVEVARKLGISPRTVQDHAASLREKTGAPTTRKAACGRR